MAQFDMFADEAPQQASANGLPPARRRLMETVVPQMTRWLPDDEAERVKRVFGETLAA